MLIFAGEIQSQMHRRNRKYRGFENLWNNKSEDLHTPSAPRKVIRVVKPRRMERGGKRDKHRTQEKFLLKF